MHGGVPVYAVFRGGPHDGYTRPLLAASTRYWYATTGARYVLTGQTTAIDGVPHRVYAYAPGDTSDNPPATGQWAEQSEEIDRPTIPRPRGEVPPHGQ